MEQPIIFTDTHHHPTVKYNAMDIFKLFKY